MKLRMKQERFSLDGELTIQGEQGRQLETLSKKIIDNAGVGGYGPCEYEQVLNELLVLYPKIVVLGLYLGNDIGDAYREADGGLAEPDWKITCLRFAPLLGAEPHRRLVAERKDLFAHSVCRQ